MPYEAMPLGVVLERHEIDNPWQRHSWHAVAVIPGAPAIQRPQLLAGGPGWERYHAATLNVELHGKETEAYRVNLSNDRPLIYVGLREVVGSTESGLEIAPFLVTASPYEAQDYLDSSEDIVECVPMPDGLIAWVHAFVDAYHVDEPFEKRKRQRFDANEVGFGRRSGGVTSSAGRGGGRDG